MHECISLCVCETQSGDGGEMYFCLWVINVFSKAQ